MFKTKLIIVVLISMLSTSCIGIKSYNAKEVEKSQTLRDTTLVSDADTLENFSWREVFTDQNLVNLSKRAL